jgi:hypothetical protein
MVYGTPQGGFNGEGHWEDETELNQPRGVSAASDADSLRIVADTDNALIGCSVPIHKTLKGMN